MNMTCATILIALVQAARPFTRRRFYNDYPMSVIILDVDDSFSTLIKRDSARNERYYIPISNKDSVAISSLTSWSAAIGSSRRCTGAPFIPRPSNIGEHAQSQRIPLLAISPR